MGSSLSDVCDFHPKTQSTHKYTKKTVSLSVPDFDSFSSRNDFSETRDGAAEIPDRYSRIREWLLVLSNVKRAFSMPFTRAKNSWGWIASCFAVRRRLTNASRRRFNADAQVI